MYNISNNSIFQLLSMSRGGYVVGVDRQMWEANRIELIEYSGRGDTYGSASMSRR